MGKLTYTIKGPIASFRSADKANIESLKFHFLPKQEGSGDPSPTNIRPITGWTGVNGYGSGENVLPFDDTLGEGYTNTADGITATYSNGIVHITGNHNKSTWTNIIDFYSVWSRNPIILPPGSYIVASDGLTVVCRYDGSETWVNKANPFTSTTPIEVKGFYVAVMGEGEKDITVPMIMTVGSVRPKKYQPYYPLKSFTIAFPDGQTIYGGYVDLVTGEIWKTHYIAEINNVRQYVSGNQYFWYVTTGELNGIPNIKSENAGLFADRLKVVSGLGTGNPENQITFYANGIIRWKENGEMSLSEYETYLENNPITICYEMATPILVSTFSPQDLKTFLDHNNFWSDANGDTEVEYAFADRLSERKLIMDTPHLETASAAVASFSTDMKALVKELKAYFTPVQEGSGDASPENIRPITGITKMNIEQTGKNLIDISAVVNGTIDGYGNYVSNNSRTISGFISLQAGTYKISRKYITDWWKGWAYKFDGTSIGRLFDNAGYEASFTLSEPCKIRIAFDYIVSSADEVQLELGSTATAYEEFAVGSEIPIEFPAMKNLVSLNYSPYAAQQNPHATIIKQTADELEFTAHGDYTYEYVRLFYMIPAGTYTAKIYASTVDENDNYDPLLSLYVNGERVPFAGIRNGQSATFTLAEDTVVDMRFFGNIGDGSQRTVKFSKFQIERGSVATDYESRAMVYGGYIDAVRGKLVATHGFFKRLYGPSNPPGVLGDYERHGWNTPMVFKSGRDLHDHGYGPGLGRTFCNIAPWDLSYFNDTLHYYIDSTVAYVMLPVGTDPDTEIEFCAELATPIEYDITPQVLKTLKGTNNIWADTNGNVEVSYWTH